MTDLVVYRDDGPVAAVLGRVLGTMLPVPASLVTLVGGILLVAALPGAEGQGPEVLLGLALVGYVLLAGSAAGQQLTGRLDWLVPPLLRVVEYGSLLTLAVLSAPAAVPACFALIGVLAFHHYDTVYRLRHQRIPPPMWVRFVGGGWELRLLLAYVLLITETLAIGMVVAAVALGVFYLVETVASWRRFSHTQRPVLYEEEEDEEE